MKKIFLSIITLFAFVLQSNAQTSKWGLSYAAEFTKAKVSSGSQSIDDNFTVNNINLHYSILSWASDFQIGPLASMRFGSVDGESFSDFQIGLNLGYNFSDTVAIVMDTYKVFDDIDDHNIFVFKPALEIKFGGKIAAQLGYHKYAYGGSWRADNNIDKLSGGGLLVGLKYKF